MNDLVQGLETGEAPGWKPEEGDILVGIVVGLSKGWSDYKNGYYPIVTIQPDLDKCNPSPPRSDGGAEDPIAIHGFQFVLEDRFTALKPMPGETIGIKQGAKIPTKDGKRSVQTYTVKMDREEDIWREIQSPRAPIQATRQQELPISEVASDDDIPF
jgi:hypothetical protein